jgi:glycosyltransferase involved in cell wall biosynthesis
VKTCLLVPHYDHIAQFRNLLPRLLATELPLIVVDDASPPVVVEELQQLLDERDGETTLVQLTENLSKGGAVMAGFRAAREAGYTHALQVDADGQHDVAAVAEFCAQGENQPDAIICGEPIFDESISGLRYYGRYLTLSLSGLETLSTEIQDAMCGFRLYPLDRIVRLIDRTQPGARMAFDPEILVRAVWEEIPLRYIPVHVRYPEDGSSHFRYLRDNTIISWMHTRLIAGMLLRLPMLLSRKITARKSAA